MLGNSRWKIQTALVSVKNHVAINNRNIQIFTEALSIESEFFNPPQEHGQPTTAQFQCTFTKDSLEYSSSHSQPRIQNFSYFTEVDT